MRASSRCWSWSPFDLGIAQMQVICEGSQNTMLCCAQSISCVQPHGLQPTRLLCLRESPGKNTGVDCLSRLQGTCPTQRLNPGLLIFRRILYQLRYQGSPRIMVGQPIPSPGELPDPGIELKSPALQANSLPAELPGILLKYIYSPVKSNKLIQNYLEIKLILKKKLVIKKLKSFARFQYFLPVKKAAALGKV